MINTVFRLFVIAGAIAASQVSAAEINVFAAASLTDALQELGETFASQTGDKVVFNFAASSLLTRQISEHAPADMFISADEAKMDPKIVPTQNVRAPLAAVESGNVEAGFVYKTDANISKKIKIAFSVPSDEGPPIRYPIAILKDAKNKNGAETFLRFLESENGQKVFERYGFIVKI